MFGIIKIRLNFVYIAIILGSAALALACEWDEKLGSYSGVRCPPREYADAKVEDTAYSSSLQRCKYDHLCLPQNEKKTSFKCTIADNENICGEGRFFCENECINPNSESSCGANGCNNNKLIDEGQRCDEDRICKENECICRAEKILCRTACVDPLRDRSHCGAKGNCSDSESSSPDFIGNACSEHYDCIRGECVLVRCPSDEQLCIDSNDNDNRFCINLKLGQKGADGQILHCGACGAVCGNSFDPNAFASGCKEGYCSYSCNKGFTNCGEDRDPLCLSEESLKSNAKHCGECNNVCQTGTNCKDGVCV